MADPSKEWCDKTIADLRTMIPSLPSFTDEERKTLETQLALLCGRAWRDGEKQGAAEGMRVGLSGAARLKELYQHVLNYADKKGHHGKPEAVLCMGSLVVTARGIQAAKIMDHIGEGL